MRLTLTPRHATGLANARFYRGGRFFWDERAASLEAQVLEPIQHRAGASCTTRGSRRWPTWWRSTIQVCSPVRRSTRCSARPRA